MATRQPNILWAQRSDKVFLTIDVQEVEKPQVKVLDAANGNGRVTFTGVGKSHATGSETHQYELDLELAGAVDADASKIGVTARHIVLVIAKKAEGYWPRLTETKQLNIKVDWDKWVDEDEEAEEAPDPSSQFDLSSLSDFSNFQAGGGDEAALGAGLGGLGGAGFPGVGGDDDENSDDEEMPELEKA